MAHASFRYKIRDGRPLVDDKCPLALSRDLINSLLAFSEHRARLYFQPEQIVHAFGTINISDPGRGDTVSEDLQETKKIFCNQCSGVTNHLLRARYSRRRVVYEDGEKYEPGEVRASIWSCAGCEEETFEWQYFPTDDEEVFPVYYPGRLERDSIQPKLFTNLSPELSQLYREVVTSFNGDCLLLCTIGLRALVERVCVDKGLTERNLEHQIDGLIKFLPSVNLIHGLHTFRFAGNDAAHRLEPLSRDQARTAISIIEDLLNFLYDLDYKALQMRNSSKRAAFRSVKLNSVQ